VKYADVNLIGMSKGMLVCTGGCVDASVASIGRELSEAAITMYQLGTCESAVCVQIEYESNQKRCAELQIPHTSPQTH